MTEKKTSLEQDVTPEQGDKKIKATTGAWWKSSVAGDIGPKVVTQDLATGQEQVPVTEAVSEAGVPAKKANRRPARPRRKKIEVPLEVLESGALPRIEEQSEVDGNKIASGQENTQRAETITEAGADAVETSVPPKKRGRRPARSRREKTSTVAPAGEGDAGALEAMAFGSVPEERAVGAVVDGIQIQGQSEATGDQPVTSAPTSEPGRRPSRSRGRRKPASENLDIQDEESDEVPDVEDEKAVKSTVSRLLINAEEPEECRIALLEDGRLESIHVSTVAREHTKSNIYKARIVAVESNLQAAFVDYGPDKNGFLPFSEIHPEYYRQDVSEKTKRLIEQHQWKNLNINEVLERGQEMLVQIVKEEVGSKGANMTTYLSLPGRCVVLMPGSDSSGISKKISGEERRSQLREIMDSLEIPEGIGWIVRTASVDLTETSLAKDVKYLLKLWGEIKGKGQGMDGVGLVYQDHDCVLRFLREHFDPEIKEILVDDLAAMEKVKDFIDLLPDKQKNTKVRLHKGARPIFNQYNVEDQIESIYQPQVFLPSGGSIVIDPTEALVAIDVNSGSTGKGQNFEDSIFKANMEAATELARQLRLRDLGGLIVVDFIDMRSQKNIREVERQVKIAMKRDKAKVDISRISKFGLMQISRQKLGAPIEALNYQICPHCLGRGVVRSVETLALFYLRRIQTGASRKTVGRVECHFPLDVALYLLNNKRHELIDLENRHKISVDIIADPALKPADHEILFHKEEKERLIKEQ
ncbi:MAG: Rne/Rng family ribonuclease [Desulfocapsaceae bacterium]|jgi:ribonuclease E|nr:Rne/Rng family ribonuclease [Desulfocapsaceae bacterium]